jgi:hypothetical protein
LGAHKLAPMGNQTGPSWLLRPRSGSAQARSGSAQALHRRCTASAQVKAATAQGRGPNWSWGKKILCPTIGVFSKDAGNYAWWDTGDEGGFSFRFHSFIEDPTSYEACHSGVLVLDIASRALHGSLSDLFRYGRLGRLGNQSGYVPHGTNTIDIDSVRKQSAAVLSRHLEHPLTVI